MACDITSFTTVDVKLMGPLEHGPEPTNYAGNLKLFLLRE